MITNIKFRTYTSYSFSRNVNSSTYLIHIKYCVVDNSYFLQIDKYTNGTYNTIIGCVKLTTGCDLLLPYSTTYKLGSLFLVPTDKLYYDKLPTPDTLMSKYMLTWEHN